MTEPQGEAGAATSQPETAIRPWRTAIMVAGIYAVVSIVYIVGSSQIAAGLAADMAQLERIERIKGVVFVLTSALLIFGLVAGLLRRVHSQQAQLQRQQDAMHIAQRHADAGLFASSVAHDLNNILVVSFACIEQLEEAPDLTEEHLALLADLKQSSEQVRDYAGRLQQVSGTRVRSGLETVDVAGIVAEASDLARSHGKVRRCVLEVDVPPRLMCVADASALHRVVLNLALNAADATVDGRIRISLTGGEAGFRLLVEDDGPGIPAAERARVLDPFHTTKADGNGLGLLSLKHCAEVHGGSFAIEGSDLGGARIVLDCRTGAQTRAEFGAHERATHGA